MTPMMLLAFTRLPLRLTHTSLLNCPATWVSFAEARACSPSLLMISTSRCSIANGGERRRNTHDPFAPPAHRLGHDGVQRFVAVSQRADQHRQIEAGHRFDLARDN